jgi:class 3 adenylate cyclase
LVEEALEFGLINRAGIILSHSPTLSAMMDTPQPGSLAGLPLADVFPEFVGYDVEIASLSPADDPIRIQRIHREQPDGSKRYVTLSLRAQADGLLLTARDVTYEGELEQRITQQRNELNLMSHELAKARLQLDDLIRRFVPPAVVDQMLADAARMRLGGERRVVTVLFTDLRGFTGWSEQQPPEAVIHQLNDLLTAAVDMVLDAGGTVNQFTGDGFMAFFNAPNDQPDHARLALHCARRITSLPPLAGTVQFAVGVNTGPVVAGNVGSPRVMDYTAIGTTTNVASRHEGLAGPGEVVFGQSTWEAGGRDLPHKFAGEFTLKGISRPARIYKLK